jgi:tetratricopeptide (TPR) repeat protein
MIEEPPLEGPLTRVLKDPVTEASLARVWRQVERRRGRAPELRVAVRWLLAGVMLAFSVTAAAYGIWPNALRPVPELPSPPKYKPAAKPAVTGHAREGRPTPEARDTPALESASTEPIAPAQPTSLSAAATSSSPALRATEASWREEAARGHHAEAYALLGSGGLEREVGRAASSEDLFTLADIARLSGHPERARAPLSRLLELYPHDARAPLAAATLGRIELDLGQPASAARAFERALAIGAPLALEEDLRARLVESWARAGDHAAARAAAETYRQHFPTGRRKAEVDRWLSQPSPSPSAH